MVDRVAQGLERKLNHRSGNQVDLFSDASDTGFGGCISKRMVKGAPHAGSVVNGMGYSGRPEVLEETLGWSLFSRLRFTLVWVVILKLSPHLVADYQLIRRWFV